MSNLKITYFGAKGRAEASRLALTIGGIEFEDERIAGEEFGKRKAAGELIFGSLPTLTIDGTQYAQSDAMLLYCGKRAGLYPTDEVKALKVDMIIGGIEDVVMAVFADSSEEGRKKFTETGVPRYFGPMEKMYGETDGPFLLGEELTVADLKMYVTVTMLQAGFIDHVPKDVLDKFENIMKCTKAVEANEKVAAWNAKH